jgi:hypothetical protein
MYPNTIIHIDNIINENLNTTLYAQKRLLNL